MKTRKNLILPVFLLLSLAAFGGRTFERLAGYVNVEIIGISAKGISVSHSRGVSTLKESDLSESEKQLLDSELTKMRRLQAQQNKKQQLVRKYDAAADRALSEAAKSSDYREKVRILSLALKECRGASTTKLELLKSQRDKCLLHLEQQRREEKARLEEEERRAEAARQAEAERRRIEARREEDRRFAAAGGKRCPACDGSGIGAERGFSGNSGIAGAGGMIACRVCGGRKAVPVDAVIQRCSQCGGSGCYYNAMEMAYGMSPRPINCDNCGASGYVRLR